MENYPIDQAFSPKLIKIKFGNQGKISEKAEVNWKVLKY